MSLLVVGMSHRTAPVPLLERASVPASDLPEVLHDLLRGDHVAEVLVLSTCNRVEVYADVDRFHGGLQDTSSVLARRCGIDLPGLGHHLYVHYEDAAVLHLFSVAAGLDSMVVGESQILGQLRTAYTAAAELDSVGRSLHELFQQALRVGKRVHAETGIDRAGASVVSVGLGEAARVLGPDDGRGAGGPLAGRRALVVGAGSMGSLAAATLLRDGVAEVTVVNRSPGRAEQLAASLRPAGAALPLVRATTLDALADELVRADVVIACTGAIGTVVAAALVAGAVERRAGRPLVLLDLALPRDIDSAAGQLRGVHYVDLEVLREPAARLGAHAEIELARAVVAGEVSAQLGARRAIEISPTVAALRARAAEVVDAELARLDGRLPGLDDAVRAELSHTVHRVAQALLHAPTVRVKQLAERPGGDAYAEALRELFDLGPAATAATVTVSPEGGAG
ncbi:MAG TPA: glutamyl-tRNA reductase [Mycobacteriales bacterium]